MGYTSSPASCPPSLDEAQQPIGPIGPRGESGIMSLGVNASIVDSTNGRPRALTPGSMKLAVSYNRVGSVTGTPDSAVEEDYDNLRQDSLTVGGGNGGGLKATNSSHRESTTTRPPGLRLRSVPATLRKANQHGNYY